MDPRGERGGRRAQLIVITALVLATVFVALALVLNSGIYSENLSTRETTDSQASVGYTQEAEAAVADAYRVANAGGASTAAEARGAFADIVDSWAEARSREAAKSGVSAGFERTAHVGWRLEQDVDLSFAPADDPDAVSWQVADGADSVAEFRMDVSREELYDARSGFDGTNSEAFHIQIADADGESWNLYVFQDSSNGEMIVHQGDPSHATDLDELRTNSSHTCKQDVDEAVIDFGDERFQDDGGCTPLNFSDDLNGPLDIGYENVHDSVGGEERINGTYTLIVNGSGAAGPTTNGQPDHFNEPGEATPTAQAVVYSVTYSTLYERSDVRFDRDGLHAVWEETYAG